MADRARDFDTMSVGSTSMVNSQATSVREQTNPYKQDPQARY
jgi:DNA helicase MCM8